LNQGIPDIIHALNAVDNDYYGGFEGLSRKIEIRCFCIDPSVKSSLNCTGFVGDLREKVESLYLYVLRQKAKQKS